MRLRNDTDIKNYVESALASNSPQHIALVYSAYDILDDKRINMENPVQLHEVYNAEEDITPGNCCSANLEAHIANTDRALNDFNFARNFGLYFGIEIGNSVITRPYSWLTTAPVYLNGVIISIYNNLAVVALQGTPATYVTYNFSSYMDDDETLAAIYATGSTVHLITNKGVEKGRLATQNSGETARDHITSATAPTLALSTCTAQRILLNAENGITEKWQFSSGYAIRDTFALTENNKITQTSTVFVGINVFKGEKPRKQLCDDIDITAQDVLTYLDADAKPFILTDFASAKTRAGIVSDIFTQVNTDTGIQFYSTSGDSLLGSDTYADNPFANFDGYTYRDLLKDIAESAGLSVRLAYFSVTLYVNGAIAFLPYLEFAHFPETGYPDIPVTTGGYYDLELDEYNVTAIQKVRVQASADDVGVILPDEPAGDNGLAIIDNPLLIGDSETEIKSHCTKIFANLEDYSGGYRPGTLVMPHNLITQAGDCLLVQADLEDSTVTRSVYAFAINTTWNGYAECTIESTGQKKREVLTKSIKQKLRSGRKYHEFVVDVDQLKSRMGDAEGNITLIFQDIDKIQTEVSSQNNTQILRDTRFINPLGQDGGSNIDWANSKWGRAVGSATSDYGVVTFSDCPDDRITRGLRMTASTTYDTAIYQDKIPVDINRLYCLSGYFRSNTASSVLTVTVKENGSTITHTNSYSLTYTETGYKWQQFVVPLSSFEVFDAKTIKIGFIMPNASGVQTVISGLKLELGSTATPWSEADEYTFTRITQTEAEVLTEMQDALGNYYTKSETASKIQTDMTDALGNYYTKTETAQKIQTDMTDALGNYYTKTETASEISTYVGNHAYEVQSGVAIKPEGVEISGGKYVKIKSGGSFSVDSGNFSIDTNGNVSFKGAVEITSGKSLKIKTGGSFTVESNNFSISAAGVLTAGNFKLSDDGFVFNDNTRLFAIRNTKAGTTDLGVNVESNGRIRIVPQYGNYGYFDFNTGSGSLTFRPQPLTGDAGGTVSKVGTSRLGTSDPFDVWDEGYITDLYYSNLYQTSSREMKEDITPLDIPGSVIDGLVPVSFRYKTGDRRTHYGLIHEDTLPLLPEICKGSAEEEPQKKAIDYMQLVTVLLSEVQKLRARVSALEGSP